MLKIKFRQDERFIKYVEFLFFGFLIRFGREKFKGLNGGHQPFRFYVKKFTGYQLTIHALGNGFDVYKKRFFIRVGGDFSNNETVIKCNYADVLPFVNLAITGKKNKSEAFEFFLNHENYEDCYMKSTAKILHGIYKNITPISKVV